VNRMERPERPRNPEVGGIPHLEHVNFETPDHEMATAFFFDGLGLTRDPYKRIDGANIGVNIGLQQFHLPRRGERTPPFPGVVALVVPDLAGVRERLAFLEKRGRFADTPFSYTEEAGAAEIVAPFGYRLRLHPAGTIPFMRPLGLAYVEVPVPPGRAEPIAAFYRKIMHAVAEVRDIGGETAAVVNMGPYQSVRFIEREIEDYATHSTHIAYYITHYDAARDAIRARSLMTADDGGELFFFDALFEPDSGETVFSINNEVRSLYHPDFMRPLVNRWPIVWEQFEDRTRDRAAMETAGR